PSDSARRSVEALTVSPTIWSNGVSGEPLLKSTIDGDRLKLAPAGAWTAEHAATIEHLITRATHGPAEARTIEIDVGGVERLDTFGAWLLERLARALTGNGREARLVGIPENYRVLIEEAHGLNRASTAPPPMPSGVVSALNSIGRSLTDLVDSMLLIVQMLGA